MVFLLGFLLPLFAFFFESYPRFIVKKYGVDIWTHLLYLKEYKRQKGIPKRIANGFLVPGEYDYPPAFIFIVSKFPLKMVEKYEFLFSPFFDAINVFLIYIIVIGLFHSILLALVTQILYSFTPIIVIENSSATPRSLGYTLFSLEFLSLFLFESNNQVIYLIFAIVVGSLIFLSHRFTTQGFLFFSLFFSIIAQNISYIGCFVVSFILAVVASKGFYLRVLQGHVGNLLFWKKNIMYRFAHQVRGVIPSKKNKDFVYATYNQFLKFPPFVLSITNPWTIPALFVLFFSFPSDAILQKMAILVGFSYILSLATIWVPSLRFLGEGQRYLELTAFPTALLASYFLLSLPKTILFLVGIFYICAIIGSALTIVVIQRKAIIKDTLRRLTPDLGNMFNYLKSLKNKPKLLCIPHQITTSTIYHTGCPVFVNADYKSIEKITDVYPFFKIPIREIMKKHKLQMVLLNTSYASVEELKLKGYSIVHKSGNYVLVKPR